MFDPHSVKKPINPRLDTWGWGVFSEGRDEEKLHSPSLDMEEGMLDKQEARVRGAMLELFLEEPIIQGADDPAEETPHG